MSHNSHNEHFLAFHAYWYGNPGATVGFAVLNFFILSQIIEEREYIPQLKSHVC